MHQKLEALEGLGWAYAALPAGILPFCSPPIASLAALPPAVCSEAVTPSHSEAVQAAAAAADTSLVPDEIPDHHGPCRVAPPATLPRTLASDFRHSGWAAVRERVYAAMQAAGFPAGRLNRFAACGSHAWVESRGGMDLTSVGGSIMQPDRYRIRCNHCRDRFCVPCANVRAGVVSRALIDLLNGRPARFITLTRKHTDAPLAEQVDALYVAYKKLRKHPIWVNKVSAAAAMLEITRNRDSGQWHPHLHVLAKGVYIPHDDLRDAWHHATGDSFIVDIRYIRDQAAAAGYVAKYVTKPMVATYSTSPEAVREALEALHHRRTVLLTGEWKSLRVESTADDAPWCYEGTLESLLCRAYAGDAPALDILRQLGRTVPCRAEPPKHPP